LFWYELNFVGPPIWHLQGKKIWKILATTSVVAERFSSSENFHIKKICHVEQILQSKDYLSGHVTAANDEAWWQVIC
jgi:hypothetical protein